MKPIRIEQRKNEEPDQFILRAMAVALPRMEHEHFLALADYMTARAQAERERMLYGR